MSSVGCLSNTGSASGLGRVLDAGRTSGVGRVPGVVRTSGLGHAPGVARSSDVGRPDRACTPDAGRVPAAAPCRPGRRVLIGGAICGT